MKTLKKLFIIRIFLLLVVVLCACGKENTGATTRVTLDINPSFELIVDENKKVVSVTALNDDASIILVGEAVVGMDSNEACKKLVEITVNAGYMDEVTNVVKVSVSGDDSFKEELVEDITKKIEEVTKPLGAKVEEVGALAIKELRNYVVKNSNYTEDAVQNMTEEELLKVLAASRIETQQLLSQEMREAYYLCKEYEIKLSHNEAVSKVLENVDSLQAAFYSAYLQAMELYSDGIIKLEELRYNLLVSSESEYQKALKALRDTKVEYLNKKKVTKTLEVGPLKVEAEANLVKMAEQIDVLIENLEKAAKFANDTFDVALKTLKDVEASLKQTESFLGSSFKELIEGKLVEIDSIVNNTKNKIFEEFEKAHKDDIEAYNKALQDAKDKLLA